MRYFLPPLCFFATLSSPLSRYNVLLLHKVRPHRRISIFSSSLPLMFCTQDLSGKLKHVKGDWGEGYPDADHCRLMVDRLCCTVFLQQQQAQEQALHIGDACQPSIDDGIFTSINHVRHAIGDSADRVMLLLFLLKGEGGASSTLSTVSQNSTPVRHHQLLPVPRALPAAPQLPISSIFLPTLPRQDSLMLIPLLGEMQVSPFHVCIFHFNSQTSLPAKCHV